MGCTQIMEWFRQFIERQLSVKIDERSGRPSMSRNQLIIDKVCSAVLGNQRITSWDFHLVWYSPF